MHHPVTNVSHLIRGLIGTLALAALCSSTAQATLLDSFAHSYTDSSSGGNVDILLSVFDGQPGGRYLWEYKVTNIDYDPVAGTTNGFSGFELFLPASIPEIADITPNPGSTPPWEVNCCSGNPVEWDIRDSVGLGIMPGEMGLFSFTTDPREIAINDDGWFHTWQSDTQVNITLTTGMHVPWVPGLEPIPEPSSLALVALALAGIGYSQRRKLTQ